jgi:AP-1-like factor
MDSVGTRRTVTPHFILSPHQQDLLLAALNSNKPSHTDIQRQTAARDTSAVAPMSLNESPLGQAPDSGNLDGLDDSPFIDYDYDFDADAGFDFDYANISQGQMIGKLPGSSSDGDVDTHDKRGHPDDEGNDEEGGGKRREGDDRSSKKPGRKPLTSEPTSVSTRHQCHC